MLWLLKNLDCCEVSVCKLEFQPFSACNQCTDHPAGKTLCFLKSICEESREESSTNPQQRAKLFGQSHVKSVSGSRLLLGARLQDMLVELQPSNDAVKADPRWLEVVHDQIMTKTGPNWFMVCHGVLQ